MRCPNPAPVDKRVFSLRFWTTFGLPGQYFHSIKSFVFLRNHFYGVVRFKATVLHPPGSLCCTGSSTDRVWRPWVVRGAPCCRPGWRRRRRSGSCRSQLDGGMGWSSTGDHPLGSTTLCSSLGPLCEVEGNNVVTYRLFFFCYWLFRIYYHH